VEKSPPEKDHQPICFVRVDQDYLLQLLQNKKTT
jgi:hypothetical protein